MATSTIAPARRVCGAEYGKPGRYAPARRESLSTLEARVGGLSRPSKMPGFAYGIPARACILGTILARKAGSVCHGCYAMKGRYGFAGVQRAQERRLAILRADLDTWAADMVALLRRRYAGAPARARYFRWHDSGDVQSVEHVLAIFAIARALPRVRFWLPTRERSIVTRALGVTTAPENLTIRISAAMVGAVAGPVPAGTVASTVGSGSGYACPAPRQGNACKACRACWRSDIDSVDYKFH